jgi:hypothetical protein
VRGLRTADHVIDASWVKTSKSTSAGPGSSSAAAGTVRFGLDGTEYEIDLNAEHAQQLRDALARYVGAARAWLL